MDDPITLPGGPLGTVTGLLLIVLGILALVFPALVFSLLIVFFAIFALMTSLELIRSGISGPAERTTSRTLQILMGIIGILVAFVILVAPYIAAVVARDVFALWAILTGLGGMISLVSGGSAMERGLNVLVGFILAACGVLILAAPAILADHLLITILGLVAIVTGIFSIWLARAPVEDEKTVDHSIYK